MGIMTNSLNAQSNIDKEIADLINKGDFLSLEKSKGKLSTASPFIGALANAKLDIALNRSNSAITQSIPYLLANLQNDLDGNSIVEILVSLAELLSIEGNNLAATQVFNDIIKIVNQPGVPQDLIKHFKFTHDKYQALSKEPPIQIIKGNDSISFVHKGNSYIFLEGNLNTHKTDFAFDTGAGGSVISKSIAEKSNVRIIADSVMISGFGDVYAQIGVADRLEFGSLIVKNMPFYIVNEIIPKEIQEKMDFRIEAVLGSDFMRLTKKIKLDLKNKKLSFPEKIQKQGSINMMFIGGALYTEVYYENIGRAVMLLDTGDITSGCFNKSFYEEHKNNFSNLKTIEDIINYAGTGGSSANQNVYKIPLMQMTVQNKEIDIHNMIIDYDRNFINPLYAGMIGIASFQNTNEIILDFEQMKMFVY